MGGLPADGSPTQLAAAAVLHSVCHQTRLSAAAESSGSLVMHAAVAVYAADALADLLLLGLQALLLLRLLLLLVHRHLLTRQCSY